MNLTDEQEAVVVAPDKFRVCLAGPGSGKTTTLIEMIARMSDEERRITAALTFTTAGAGEIKKRLGLDKPMFFAGTTHAFCLRVIRREYARIGIKPAFTVLDEEASKELLSSCCERLNYLTMSLDNVKAEIKRNPRTIENPEPLFDLQSFRVAMLYHTRLIEGSMLDYDSLLSYGLFLLKGDVVWKPKQLIIDEAQDSSELEWEIYRAIKASRYVFVGDVDQCQPKGTMVRRIIKEDLGKNSPRYEDVPIEGIAAGDRVPSWMVGSSHFFTRGDKVKRVACHHYDGDLIVATSSKHVSRYTPEHRCIAKLTGGFEGKHAVYLMKKGYQFRIGKVTGTYPCARGGYGLTLRAKCEAADEYWMLAVYETDREARMWESILSLQYGIPTLSWKNNQSRGCATQEYLDKFWSSYSCDFNKAVELLKRFGRDINYPLGKRTEANLIRRRLTIIRACNLMSGMEMMDADANYVSGNHKKNWIPVQITREKYSGQVYSLDVANRSTYIADGMFTHNSIYQWREATPDELLSLTSNPRVKTLTITRNHRSGPVICNAATRLIGYNAKRFDKPVVSVKETGGEILVQHFATQDHELDALSEWCAKNKEKDVAILCRYNRECNAVRNQLQGDGIKIKGRSAKPKGFLEATAMMAAFADPGNDEAVFLWLKRKSNKGIATDIKSKAMLAGKCIAAYHPKIFPDGLFHAHTTTVERLIPDEKLIEYCMGHIRHEETLEHIRDRINVLGTDMPMHEFVIGLQEELDAMKGEGMWVSTIHRAKGLEWDEVYLPFWNSQAFPQPRAQYPEEERRLAFVAVTRARNVVNITWAKEVPYFERTVSARASIFIKELNPAL